MIATYKVVFEFLIVHKNLTLFSTRDYSYAEKRLCPTIRYHKLHDITDSGYAVGIFYDLGWQITYNPRYKKLVATQSFPAETASVLSLV